MITKKIKGGRDTWVGSAASSKTHSGTGSLSVNNASSATSYAFLMPGWRPPRNTIIISAKLQLRAYKASSGTRTVSAYRVSGSWKVTRTNWNNKPAVTGSATTVDIGALSDGDLVELDVTSQLQTVANGGKFYGWRISTTATSAHSFYSMNAGKHNPMLVVQYAYSPAVPTGLISGGAVSTGTPYLHFDYDVFSGNLSIASVEAQIDPNANATAPAWDSGEIATTQPELDLSTTTYPGLADGATTYWRVRYKTTDGYWSDYSAWATFSRVAKGVLTIDAPAAAPNDLVTESTPPILWTFTNQTKYQVIITPAGQPSKVLHNSGVIGGSDQSWTPPSGVIKTPGARYTVRVRVWDGTNRVASAGDPTYVEASQDFTFSYSADTAPVTNLVASQPAGFPRVRLELQRSTPPDSWSIERDGAVVADNIAPDDLLVSGTSYAWEDWTAAPFTAHTYKVVPVVNGKAAASNPSVTASFRSVGVWVGDPATGWYFNLLEQDVSGLVYGEDADVTPMFAQVTRKISSMRGLEGSVTGVLVDETEFDPRAFADQLADLLAIKGRGQRIFRLAVADMNVPVLVGQLSPSPSSDYLEGIEQRAVSFSVWQQGELPFIPVAGA